MQKTAPSADPINENSDSPWETPKTLNHEPANNGSNDPIVRRTPFFYGWVMLGVAMAAQYATSPGQTYGVSLFNKHIATMLATQRAEEANPGVEVAVSHEMIEAEIVTVATAYLFGTVLAAFPVPWIGALSDRLGLRMTMTLVVLFFGAACLFMSQVQGPYTLFVGFLLIRTLGQGSLTLLASNTSDMWFHTKLGFANGIRNLSAPIAFASFPLITIPLINYFGWQNAYAFLGLGVWGLMLPLLLIFFRNRPEDVGQLPDGVLEPTAEEKETARKFPIYLPQLSLGEAFKERSFWITVSMMTLWGMIGTALMFMLIPYLESKGLAEEDAQVVYISIAIAMALNQFIGGWFADKVRLNYLMMAGATCLGVGTMLFMLVDSVWMAGLYGVVFGTGQGVTAASTNSLFARYFGRAHLGKIKGFSMMSVVAGSAAGPFLLSAGNQWLGGYNPVLWLFVTMFLSQAIASFFATPPAERQQAAEPQIDHNDENNSAHGTDSSSRTSTGNPAEQLVQTAD